jgi:hypothetical protein
VSSAAPPLTIDGQPPLSPRHRTRAHDICSGTAIWPLKLIEILDRAVQLARGASVASSVEVDPAAPPARVVLDWSAQRDLLAIGAPLASRWRARNEVVALGARLAAAHGADAD